MILNESRSLVLLVPRKKRTVISEPYIVLVFMENTYVDLPTVAQVKKMLGFVKIFNASGWPKASYLLLVHY